jgi:hypothetical protein
MPAGEGGAIIGGVIDELKSGSAGEPEAEEPEEE